MTQAGYNKGKSETVVATPQDFRDAIVKRWSYPAIDLACEERNRFGSWGFYSHERDSLAEDWKGKHSGLCWLNPPYDNIAPWARKAADSGANILMLVPASIGTNWFRDVQSRCDVIPIGNPRIKFDGHKNGYPKDLMLLVFPGKGKLLPQWDWKNCD